MVCNFGQLSRSCVTASSVMPKPRAFSWESVDVVRDKNWMDLSVSWVSYEMFNERRGRAAEMNSIPAEISTSIIGERDNPFFFFVRTSISNFYTEFHG